MANDKAKIQSRLQELEARKRKVENELKFQKRKLKEQARKARTRRLIEVGGLADIAGLIETDPAALLGAMLQVSQILQDELTFKMMKSKGDEVLRERAASRRRASF